MSSTISANSAGGGGLVSSGDASGVLALQTAGVTALSIDASQKVTFANSLTSPTLVTPVINGMASSILTSGTAVASTSGTSIDFTGIPSWVKRITVMFNGVSSSGTSPILVQIGSGSVISTGYAGQASSGAGVTADSTGFVVHNNVIAAQNQYGAVSIVMISSNTYVESGVVGGGNAANSLSNSCGALVLSGALDRVRITTVNGTDLFDAGSINILYE